MRGGREERELDIRLYGELCHCLIYEEFRDWILVIEERWEGPKEGAGFSDWCWWFRTFSEVQVLLFSSFCSRKISVESIRSNNFHVLALDREGLRSKESMKLERVVIKEKCFKASAED